MTYRRIFRSTSPFISGRDENASFFGCLLIVIVPMLFIVSTCLAWWELRYFLQGRTALATVDGIEKVSYTRRGPLRYHLDVRYSFKDELADCIRSEQVAVPLSWPHPVGGTFPIEYVPRSPGASRLEGDRHLVAPIFFVVCAIGSVIFGGLLLREAHRAVREDEAFESRRRHNLE
jgi:hypothetical protein